MPITTIGSYLTTLDEFIAHWDDVNLELGGTPTTDLTLQAGYTQYRLTKQVIARPVAEFVRIQEIYAASATEFSRIRLPQYRSLNGIGAIPATT